MYAWLIYTLYRHNLYYRPTTECVDSAHSTLLHFNSSSMKIKAILCVACHFVDTG